MEFKDRLRNYREELGIDKKRIMADKLNIGESFYNLLESGNRPVSKNILKKLVIMSGRPESYWIYGVENEKEYINNRINFSSLSEVISQLKEKGHIKDGIPSEKGWELIKEGLILDLKFMDLKDKED